jgi:hypothetical protein
VPQPSESLQTLLVDSPRTASGDHKVFEDVFAFASLQRRTATAATDLPVEIDVIALHAHELVTGLALWAVE